MKELIDFIMFSAEDISGLDGFMGVVMTFVAVMQNIAWVIFLFILPFQLISMMNGVVKMIYKTIKEGENQ